MKPIKIFHQLKALFLLTITGHDIYSRLIIPLCILTVMAVGIWIGGPFLIWQNYTPLIQQEKRIYVILFLFLVWLLKFLIIDLDASHALPYKDKKIKKKLYDLQLRFQGALQFLKKTTVIKYNKTIPLSQLPWYLLIGPVHAGKTALLTHSDVHFILQRRVQNKNSEFTPQCDWWITRDACIVDVPGRYISSPIQNQHQPSPLYPLLWSFFLRLIKKQRGKNGLNGIIIAIPLPEIMMQHEDIERYQTQWHGMFKQLEEMQKIFPRPIPCRLIITKCDLLPGFSEFFTDIGNDEITQAWGFALSETKESDKIHDKLARCFDTLIKTLNQQLLWRLHQERNPIIRPAIKDFPLQVERIKEFTLNFVKRFYATHTTFSLQGVYLTSALQNKTESTSTIIDEATSTTQRAVQLFKAPSSLSRAYFIKQLITHGFINSAPVEQGALVVAGSWKHRAIYAASISVIGLAATFFGQDFAQSVQQTYVIQNHLTQYQIATRQPTDPDEHLLMTLSLLNTLKQSANNERLKANFFQLLSFYSYKSHEKADLIYQQVLQNVLLPEIKDYLADYLKTPVNKNTEYVYADLKAYLMLGDAAHFDSNFIASTIQQIMPAALQKKLSAQLFAHIAVALNSAWQPLSLDIALIKETQKYLMAQPNFQLGYIILKNMNSNSHSSEIVLGTNKGHQPALISHHTPHQVLLMFTAKSFATILSQETTIAAQETMSGNWVLGSEANKTASLMTNLIDQLRSTYINNYIDVWEKILATIHLATPHNLAQTDAIITGLMSTDSPLLQLLQTLRENTYFEPLASASPKLQSLGSLLNKDASDNLLYQIFSGLQSLHSYLQPVLTASDQKKAAFDVVSVRMQHNGNPDAITQLRLIAEKSPEPIKNWLNKITDATWHFLMQEAGHYIDISWQEQVSHAYQTHINGRYPFSLQAEQDVDMQKFIDFFGHPGVLTNFYNHYLQAFIDTATPDWRWKTMDNYPLPFSNDTLRQIQHAMRIQQVFFPNMDNKIYVQFSLQPYKFSKQIKSVRLNINDKQFVDEKNNLNNVHVITWSNSNELKLTSIHLTMTNRQTISHDFQGDWGWFKLVNQSFESMITKKKMLINLSLNEYPVKYFLFTDEKINPFTSLNLSHFRLPEQLTLQKV